MSDISPELKKRFATDCCIPIDIFDEPIFTSRLELFDRFYNTIERYNVFLDMLKERYTTYDMTSTCTVTAVAEGNVDITAQSRSNPEIEANCNVTIIDDKVVDEVESITIDRDTIYLAVGSGFQLHAHILPENLEDKRILWGTSDKSTVSVAGGYILGMAKTGEDEYVTITAMSNKNKKMTATCKVYVTDPIVLTGLDFVYHQTELEFNTTETLQVHAVPDKATSTDLKFISSDPSIAEVDDHGTITTKGKQGWCAITVYSSSNPELRDTCYVLVHNIVPAAKIVLDKTELTLCVGGTDEVGYTVLPVKATNKQVVWESSDTSIVEVDQYTGVITAKGRGQAVVSAHAILDHSRYAECLVTVESSLFVRSIKLDPSEVETTIGQQFTITADVSVGYGIDPRIRWMSGSKLLATIAESSDDSTQKSVDIHAQDYYNDYNEVKHRIMSKIKNSSGYEAFTKQPTASWKPECNCLNGSIYTPGMDGHTMISIKLDKARFNALYYWDPSIFDNINSWENVVSTIGKTDNNHIIYSENLLAQIVECMNVSRVDAYSKYLLSVFYTNRVKPIIDSDYSSLVEMVYFGKDEIVLDTSKLTTVLDSTSPKFTNRLMKLFRSIQIRAAGWECPVCHSSAKDEPLPIITRLFTLYKLKTEYTDESGDNIIDATEIPGYMKNIYFEGNQPIEFINNDPCQLPMLMRSMSYQAIQEDDRKFMHEGLIASFTDDHTIHVPQISSVPDVPKDIPVTSKEEN